MLPSLPIEMESRVIPAAAPPQPATLNDFGTVLSPSQVRTFRDCGAKWYYKYALGLPDPPNGSLVRGRVVDQMAEAFFRAKLGGGSPASPPPGQIPQTTLVSARPGRSVMARSVSVAACIAIAWNPLRVTITVYVP